MLLLPALDLRGGRLARAPRGTDAAALVGRWRSAGVTWVHLVDMDRALGVGDNTPLVRSLLADARVRWQLGGGLAGQAVSDALAWGAARVIVGAAGATTLGPLVVRHGAARVGIALDVQAGVLESPPGVPIGEPAPVEDAAYVAGVTTLVYRDLTRDGGLGGPALAAVGRLRDRGFAVLVAGGVATLADVTAAREAGAAGVIVGRALLDGHLEIEEVLACCG